MSGFRGRWVLNAVFALLMYAGLSGCGDGQADAEQLATAQQALEVDVSRQAISYDYATRPSLPAGVAAARRVTFVGQPLEGRVVALSRLDGREVGELPPPPQGFLLPFNMHRVGEGRVAVLDAGGLPDPSMAVSPTIYVYEHTYDAQDGFSAELVREISFAQVEIGFAEDFVRLEDGRYLLSDAILGSLWIAEPDGTLRPGIVPESFQPEDLLPELAFCPEMPQFEVDGVPFLFTGSTLPGISPLAVRDDTLYFYSPCAEGLYSLPLASLFDERAPHERVEDIELVSPKPSNIQVEQLLGLTFAPESKNDPHIYAADSLQLRIIRIDVESGEREVVASDTTLFNFPSSLAFPPPVLGSAPLVTVSNQQHRTPLTNDAITENMFEPPFLVTKTFLFGPRHSAARRPLASAR